MPSLNCIILIGPIKVMRQS